MSLQFVDFKKRIGNDELAVEFQLADKESLAIINSDIKILKIFKNIFSKKEDYRGKVLVNGSDIRKQIGTYLFSDEGLYSNFSLYQNFRFLFSINGIRIKKEEVLKCFEELALDEKKRYSDLETGEKERVEILLAYFFSKELVVLDLSERKYINSKLISSFLRKKMSSLEKNIIVLARDYNEISSLMTHTLMMDGVKQEYFGKKKDFDIISKLVVLELSDINEKELEKRLPFDFTVVNKKFIIEKSNIEAALYYFVSNNIEVYNISDFAENDDLYVKGE
ncbi:MAG: hypothetical protein Q3988_05075 [Gemella sp.]|nr:hypothetical protein [Gemella sp.]